MADGGAEGSKAAAKAAAAAARKVIGDRIWSQLKIEEKYLLKIFKISAEGEQEADQSFGYFEEGYRHRGELWS